VHVKPPEWSWAKVLRRRAQSAILGQKFASGQRSEEGVESTLNDDEKKKFFYLTGLKAGPIPLETGCGSFPGRRRVTESRSRVFNRTPAKIRFLDASTTHGRGNADDPPLGPRTAGGANANTNPDVDDTLARQLADQIENPVQLGGVTLKKIYPPPAQNQTYGNTPTRGIGAVESSQALRDPHDFNVPNPLPLGKPSAKDSSGVEELPDSFVTAGKTTPIRRVDDGVHFPRGTRLSRAFHLSP